MILLKSGMIAICGDNSQSQLTLEGGDPFMSFSVIPKLMEICQIQCSTFLTAQNFDRELFIFGAVPFLETYLTETTNGFWKLDGYNLILDYSVGDNFIIINDVKAGVFTCGKNDKGQLGRSNDMGTGFDVVTQLIQVKIKSICCGHDFVLCELGVKPLHPRDELLIQRLEEMERSVGNEELPGMQGANILTNLEATPDQKAEINSDFRNSANMGMNNGFEINAKKTTITKGNSEGHSQEDNSQNQGENLKLDLNKINEQDSHLENIESEARNLALKKEKEEEKEKRKLLRLRKIFKKTENELNFSLTELIEEFTRVKNSAILAEEKLIKLGVKRLNQMKVQIEENEERVENERIRIQTVFGEVKQEWEEEFEEEEDEEFEEDEFLDEVDDDGPIDNYQDDVFSKRLVTRKKRVVRRH